MRLPVKPAGALPQSPVVLIGIMGLNGHCAMPSCKGGSGSRWVLIAGGATGRGKVPPISTPWGVWGTVFAFLALLLGVDEEEEEDEEDAGLVLLPECTLGMTLVAGGWGLPRSPSGAPGLRRPPESPS